MLAFALVEIGAPLAGRPGGDRRPARPGLRPPSVAASAAAPDQWASPSIASSAPM